MTTTYKLLSQYFLQRDDSQTTTTGGGYYYGSGGGESTSTDNDTFNNRFNSIEVDQRFSNVDVTKFSTGLGVYQNIRMREIENNKILIFGFFNSVNGDGSIQQIAILNEDGSLDNSFTPAITNGLIFDVKQLSDGKFIVGGNFTTVSGTTNNRLVKLNENGSDYGADFTPNFNNTILSLQIDKDQNIIVGGSFTTVGGVTRNRVAKVNSYNGELDSNFNPDVNNSVSVVALQPDGKIIIGGEFTSVGGVLRNYIARLNSDGTLDQSFVPTNSSDSIAVVNHIVVRPDGKIIVAGSFTSFGGYQRKNIVLLNNDGTVDTSFNLFPRSTSLFNINSVSLQKDNKIILGGLLEIDNDTERNLLRLNEDGSLDTSFIVKSSANPRSLVLKNGNILMSGDPREVPFTNLGFFGTVIDGIQYSSAIIKLKEKVDVAPYKLIYTVPSNTNVILGSIFSTNQNEFPSYYDIAIVPYSDTTISEKHYFVWDSLLLDNDFEVLKDKITLSAGDKIYVYSSTDENMSFNIFGTEITA